MPQVNLLKHYPKTKRNTRERAQKKSLHIQKIARKFDREYFDGDRLYGYGGFYYHPRFWQDVVPDFQNYYNLTEKSSILDVGCAKGFMLYDFQRLVPGITVSGIDISEYAIANAIPEVKKYLQNGNAVKLPYADKSFDLVISINTVHNLALKECMQALKEIQRVSRKHAFITVDAYRTPQEKQNMFEWNLTALTILSAAEWEKLFAEVGYAGDYDWFMP